MGILKHPNKLLHNEFSDIKYQCTAAIILKHASY